MGTRNVEAASTLLARRRALGHVPQPMAPSRLAERHHDALTLKSRRATGTAAARHPADSEMVTARRVTVFTVTESLARAA